MIHNCNPQSDLGEREGERPLEERLGLGMLVGRGLVQRAPGGLSPRNGIWHPASKTGKVQKANTKDAFSIGFYFRANGSSCHVESKRTQLPRFNNKVGTATLILEKPCFTFGGFSSQ